MYTFYNLPAVERVKKVSSLLSLLPGGDLFQVTTVRHSWGREDVFVAPKDPAKNQFKFAIWELDDKLATKVRLASEALSGNLAKIDHRVCCALAKRESCVCEIRCSCPLHGGNCIGSHD